MRRQIAFVAAGLLLTGSSLAYAQTNMAPAGMAGSRMSPSAMADMAKSPTSYITAAGESDKFEITEGKLAETMATSPKVKAFAAKMVHDHTESTMMVLKAAKMSGLPKMQPAVLRPAQQDMVAKLKMASGPAFDQLYIQQQMQAHQKALMVQQNYAENGTNRDLKMAAKKIVPVVQEHISLLQGLQSGM